MKKVFTYIAILFAAACAMPATAYGADDETGSVELSKKVKDNQDGTYTLTLESFVTGETVQKLVTQPCDIVLVLDNTSSMYKTNMDGTNRTNYTKSGSRIDALISAIASDGGFIDQIYQSAKDGKVSHNLSIVEFKGGIKNRSSAENQQWWTNTENEYSGVFHDSDLTYIHNRETISVTSTMSEWGEPYLTDWMSISGESTTAKDAIKDAINRVDGIFDYCYKQDTNNNLPKGATKTGANSCDGGTPSGSGLKRAGQLLNDSSIASDGHPKIVIFFTDGQCGYDNSWNKSNRAMACEVISQANKLKDKNVTIYSIGTFGSSSANNDTNGYLNHVSSKFKTEVTTDKNGNFVYSGEDVNPTAAADNEYVFLASNQEALAEAFKKISQKVKEASEAYDLDDKSAVVLDVLTHMFKLPKGADKTQINLYTCDVVTNNLSEKVKWVDTGVTTGGNKIVNKDADNNIIDDSAAGDHKEYWVKIDDNTAASMTEIQGVDDEEIYVTGFNYADNYVGIVKESGQIKGWHNPGKKLIIQFDIVTDPANTGGLTLVTNEEQSGIYKINEKGDLIRVETYEQPVVQLPYLRIIKQGLEVGESATFTVVKTLDAEGKEIDYTDQKYTAKVIITRKTEAETEPYATLKLLHSGYYRVTESSWAWTYTPNGSTEQTKHLTTVKSSDETPNNIEYVFSNTKKKEGTSGYIEGAEDYIRNNLTTGKKIQPTVPSGGTEDDGSIN